MPRKKITPLFSEPEKPKEVKKSGTPEKKITSKKKEIKDTPSKKGKVTSKNLRPKKDPKISVTEKIDNPAKPVNAEVKEKKSPVPPKVEIPKEEKKVIKRVNKKPDKDPDKVIKHKLKVGDRVLVTFLGTPTEGVIIQLTEGGLYKVKSERGTILPRAKHSEDGILDRYYPSYIIKVINKK